MNPLEWLRQIDDARVVAAIAEAERKTSGEIRVYISHRYRDDAFAAARKRFHSLRMHKTRERNAVLLYFVPRFRTFVVLGDTGIDTKCGEGFWEANGRVGRDLKKMPATDAIVNAVRKIGEILAQHFPHRDDDVNELPDDVGREK